MEDGITIGQNVATAPKWLINSTKTGAALLLLILLSAYISFTNYLLFHSLIELFSVIIAFSVFIIAVNTHKIATNNYFMFVGIAYGFVGGFNLLHALAYKGMGIFASGGANLATQLWVITRYIESVSLLIAPLFFYRPLRLTAVLAAYTAVSGLLLLSVFYWQIFPDCFIDSHGLTFFKKLSEYIICVILLLAFEVTWSHKKYYHPTVLPFLLLVFLTTIMAELCFTFYVDVYGLSNMFGHLFKFASFYFTYKAMVATNLQEPHKLLYYKLGAAKQEIEERKQAEQVLQAYIEELKQTKSVLREKEKLVFAGQIAASMAHEIKNPLTTVRGYAQLLQKRYNHDQKLVDCMASIIAEVDQASSVIDGFMQLACPTPPVTKKQALGAIVEEIIGAIDRQAFLHGIEIEYYCYEKLPECLLDKNQIRQALLNICQNAIEAMPGGGKLGLRLGRAGNAVCVEIADTGCGIPAEQLPNLGVPFYTSKVNRTGMGLSIAYSIINAHKGRIEVDSQVGQGTTFRILVPAVSV
ncbi:MASE3 domain-containing protein [Sporolituus thermophilus]|uniref:histidine kinase n=1 Tax=Sporolituus thermophilus DSM 23256 TaxID=1123285 RepID=A0A1G7N0L3_9FIRM|nr:MASE3 domain-containing protein [Sporolituus thermophilus]SDF67583.1 Signal transduction histidine kinase [Sporolituus thermophilus DSM 23256]